MVVVAGVRVFLTTTGFPQTFDEPVHVLCGLEWLERGTYTIEEQHPPLARVAVALGPFLHGAVLPGKTDVVSLAIPGTAVLFGDGEDYQTRLMLARLGSLSFLVALCGLIAYWSKRWFGAPGALVSVALLTTTPPLLAHAGLATTDMAATATLCAAIGSLFWLISKPSLKIALVSGVLVGLAVLAKLSSIPFLGLCVAVMVAWRLLLGPSVPWSDAALRRRSASYSLAAVAACSLIVWAGLLFSVGPLLPVADRPHESVRPIADTLSIGQGTLNSIVEAGIYPAPEIFRGILQVRQHNREGHLAYLLGDVRSHGWWYFFPVVIAIKTPIPFLILGLLAIGLLVKRGFDENDWRQLALVSCVAVILGFAMTANINLGVRHVLILYPLLALCAGVVGQHLTRSRTALLLGAGLLCWQGAESLLAHPDYLPYFNQFVGDHPEEFRVDSDLDWGQDLYRLVQATEDLGIERLYLQYYGTAYPEAYGMPPTEALPPEQEVSGWVAISLSSLKLYPAEYGWLERYEPHSLVGHSIRLYDLRGE